MTQHTDATSDPPSAAYGPPEPPPLRMTQEEIAKVYTYLPPWLRSRGATREQAEDNVQQALIITVTRAAEPPGLRNPVGYAYQVGRNLLAVLWRTAGREAPSEEAAERPGLWSQAVPTFSHAV